jgi:hypothetical protein
MSVSILKHQENYFIIVVIVFLNVKVEQIKLENLICHTFLVKNDLENYRKTFMDKLVTASVFASIYLYFYFPRVSFSCFLAALSLFLIHLRVRVN